MSRLTELRGWSDTPEYYQLQHEIEEQITSFNISYPNTVDYRALSGIMLKFRHGRTPISDWSLCLDFESGDSFTVKASLN